MVAPVAVYLTELIAGASRPPWYYSYTLQVTTGRPEVADLAVTPHAEVQRRRAGDNKTIVQRLPEAAD